MVSYRIGKVGNSIEHTHTHTRAHTDMDERKFQYKRCGDLCCAPPCSIQAKVLGPELGNMCQPTLSGPVNNGLSQEQVAVT